MKATKLFLRAFLAVILMGLPLLLPSGAALRIGGSQPQTNPLRIYCIDVDQGSSTLIVTPNGRSILIDCGDDGKADAVYEVITSQAQLSAIDHFVCTHYHDDHYGALDKLIARGLSFSGTFYDRDSQNWLGAHRTGTDDYQEYDTIAADRRDYLRPGEKISIDPSVEIECIVANGRAKGEYGPITYPADENGYSLGLIVTYNGFDFLIAGDVTEDVEDKLIARQGVLEDVDVYHVSHHGADTSSCQDFLNVIKPEVCIVSSGTNGTYKHPRKVTIERLESIPSEIYQLNMNTQVAQYAGTIKNVPDDHIGDPDCVGDEGTILIEVTATDYTVRLLGPRTSKTFPIQK